MYNCVGRQAKHDECLAATSTPESRVARLLAYSRALLNFAQTVLEADVELQSTVLDLAIVEAEAAATVDTGIKLGKAQHAACLICKSKAVEDEEEAEDDLKLLEQAVALLRDATGSSDPDEEAETLQLLAQALLSLGQAAEDDDAAEALIGEGVKCYEKAAELQPDNTKLAQIVQLISQQTE